MKVFSLLSLGRNLENFKKQGEADLHHLYGYLRPSGVFHTSVGCCLFASRYSRTSTQINELLHTFFDFITATGASHQCIILWTHFISSPNTELRNQKSLRLKSTELSANPMSLSIRVRVTVGIKRIVYSSLLSHFSSNIAEIGRIIHTIKMKRFSILVCLLLLFSSCTLEFDQLFNLSRPEASGTGTVFYATTESSVAPETKTFADAQMRVLWNEGDQITIFNKITYGQGFTFDGEDGDTAGGFEPFTQLPSFGYWGDLDYVYAVYPYSTNNKSDYDGNLTVMLPSEQSYKENSFGIGANTMVAVSSTNRLPFKNVGGYLSFRLYGDGVKVSSVTIKGNNNEKIAGKAKVTIPLNGTPTTVMDNSATDAISIVCDPAIQLGADAEHYTDFWFVIPPVTFTNGFTITVTDDLGGVFERRTSSSLTINRNQLDWMNPLKVTPNYDNVMIQFEDANFKAYCVENFDGNNDGEISISEAKLVESIDVNNKNIASLVGIEFFENLRSLYCGWNQLTSLDVSNNTALTRLGCSYNQLTTLDVSNNAALLELYCSYDRLTTLNVSSNTALTGLSCGGNQLTTLVVSNNTSLKELSCDYNQLTTLDVSHNTELKQLRCNNNQLTALDVSDNIALAEFVCYDNQLATLDVTNNTALTGLSCSGNPLTTLDVSNNIALQSLLCTDNQLTSLDVSNNTALTLLMCGKNQLTTLNVSNNTELQVLSCGGNQLTTLNVSNNTKITTLDCFINQLTTLDVSDNTALQELSCSNNPYLTEIWLKTGQTIPSFTYDTNIATIYYKD